MSDLRIGKYDGWIAALLVGSLIFGPRTAPGNLLPPIRSDDFIILFLFLGRWLKANRLYGGYVFSRRLNIFSILMCLLSVVLLFSVFMNVVAGRYSFYIKDIYQPIVFIRSVFIATIMASLYYGDKQIKQFIWSVLFIGAMAEILALLQKFKPYLVAGVVERFYSIEYSRLEIEMTGTQSRVVGTFGNPNLFSACLVILALSALAIAVYMKGFVKLVGILMFTGLAVTSTVATASRTAFVALGITTTLGLLISLRGGSRIWVLLLMAMMVVGFMFFRANVHKLNLNERMRDIVTGSGSVIDESMANRFVMWARDIRETKQSPLWGLGSSKAFIQITDNGYIIMFRFTGLMGLSTYLIMLLLLLRRSAKALLIVKSPLQNALMLMCFLVLINHMLFEVTADFFWSVQYGSLFAAFMGMLCGISAQIIDERECSQNYNYEGIYEPEPMA